MKEQKDNSSLPILLAISGTVLLIVAIGWFLLDQDTPTQIDPSQSQSVIMQETTSATPASDVPVSDIDANFRKARLAAEADILAYPPEQSALYFYGRILAAEPDHAVAKAELDAVLSRISRMVTDHLAAAEFRDAYALALLVAKIRPGHPLVHEVQQTLDDSASELVAQAMQHTQDGNDEDATAALVAAEALPGRQSDYFAAVRDSISEIQESRKAAKLIKIESTKRAAAQANKDWVDKVRNAIDSGQLITPPGDNARDYLVAWSGSDEQKEQLTEELVAALVTESKMNIGLGQLPITEMLLDAADELSGDDAELVELRDSLERAYIEAEANRVISTNELVRVKTAQPRYPRRAAEHFITGWVELTFTVTSAGETDDIEVSQSEPESVFDEAAIRAVEQWIFEPRVFRGQRMNQRAGVRLVFRLD